MAYAQIIPLPGTAEDPLPPQFVWMPKGEHQISAFGADGEPWQGTVICDEAGCAAVQAKLAQVLAAGRRVYLDKDHDDGAATAWVSAFSWDPAQGIVVHVAWTSLGEQLLRGKVYHSFSPAFLLDRKTGRVSGFPAGHAAGGLVNAPAFGAAMPALIAARLAGAEIHVNPASGGSPGTKHNSTMNKELLLQILAALAVQVPADATDEQVTALFAKHKDQLVTAAQTNAELRAKLTQFEAVQAKAKADADELVQLRAKEAQRRKADAQAAVDAAVARGALPPKDEKIQAKWLGLIEADPSHASLLASMPGNPALQRVTTPGGGVQVKDGLVECLRAMSAERDPAARGAIYAREVSPLFKPGFALGPILAANSLGTLTGELVVQRSLSMLKLSYPFLRAITTDYSSENAAYGQTIKTRLRGALTANTYDPDTGYGTNNASTTDVSITINQNVGVPVTFNVNELASTNRDLFGEQAEGAHYAIGTKLVDALFALITTGNYTKHTDSKLSVFARSVMTSAAKEMSKDKVAPMGRFALLNPDFFEKLGQDATLVQLAAYQRPELITEYSLPRTAGFTPYEAVSLPATSALAGFFGTSESLALATRVPNDYTAALPGASNGVVQVVTNPDTGISVQLVRYVDHTLAAATSRIALMFGVAVGNPATGRRLVQTAES